VRLFFAVELPEKVQQELGGLGPAGADPAYRWVEPSLLHITLAFLGEQPEQKVEHLETIGRTAAAHSRNATLRLGQAGHFGAQRAPRVLLVHLQGDLDALSTLQADLDARLRAAGFALEDRPYRPHITLARRRQNARGGPPPGWPPSQPPRASFPLHELTLFQSRLSPRGATYLPLARFPLAG
jgi:2'-5' RNA ligase